MRDLRSILEHRSSREGRDQVLGTVVDVAGSSYRRPGARMLVDRDGERVGLISGGCLERDVVKRAFEWTEEGARTVLFDTRSDELHPEGPYGTGCEGVVKILLERVGPDDASPLSMLRDVIEGRESRTAATVFAAEGEESLVGERFMHGGEGSRLSNIPRPLRTELHDVLAEAEEWSRPKSVTLTADPLRIRLLVEPLRPPIDLVVFGAGDDARPVARLAGDMGWDVRVADPRASLATSSRFPGARELYTDPAEVLADRVDVGDQSYVVVMTHDFEMDAELIPDLLESEAPYVGLLGPRSRTRRLIERLRDRGRLPDPDRLDRLQTPVGLDLGAEAPSEVALSIVSAVLAADKGGSGEPLQQREGRIHEPHERLDRSLEATT